MDGSQDVQGIVLLRIEQGRLFQVRASLRVLLEFAQDKAQVDQRAHVVRCQCEGLPIALRRLLQIALLEQRAPALLEVCGVGCGFEWGWSWSLRQRVRRVLGGAPEQLLLQRREHALSLSRSLNALRLRL